MNSAYFWSILAKSRIALLLTIRYFGGGVALGRGWGRKAGQFFTPGLQKLTDIVGTASGELTILAGITRVTVVCSILLGLFLPASASAYSYDEIVMMVKAEEKVFGQADYSKSLDQRLESLEVKALGAPQSGSDSVRLRRICRSLGLQKQEGSVMAAPYSVLVAAKAANSESVAMSLPVQGSKHATTPARDYLAAHPLAEIRSSEQKAMLVKPLHHRAKSSSLVSKPEAAAASPAVIASTGKTEAATAVPATTADVGSSAKLPEGNNFPAFLVGATAAILGIIGICAGLIVFLQRDKEDTPSRSFSRARYIDQNSELTDSLEPCVGVTAGVAESCVEYAAAGEHQMIGGYATVEEHSVPVLFANVGEPGLDLNADAVNADAVVAIEPAMLAEHAAEPAIAEESGMYALAFMDYSAIAQSNELAETSEEDQSSQSESDIQIAWSPWAESWSEPETAALVSTDTKHVANFSLEWQNVLSQNPLIDWEVAPSGKVTRLSDYPTPEQFELEFACNPADEFGSESEQKTVSDEFVVLLNSMSSEQIDEMLLEYSPFDEMNFNLADFIAEHNNGVEPIAELESVPVSWPSFELENTPVISSIASWTVRKVGAMKSEIPASSSALPQDASDSLFSAAPNQEWGDESYHALAQLLIDAACQCVAPIAEPSRQAAVPTHQGRVALATRAAKLHGRSEKLEDQLRKLFSNASV